MGIPGTVFGGYGVRCPIDQKGSLAGRSARKKDLAYWSSFFADWWGKRPYPFGGPIARLFALWPLGNGGADFFASP